MGSAYKYAHIRDEGFLVAKVMGDSHAAAIATACVMASGSEMLAALKLVRRDVWPADDPGYFLAGMSDEALKAMDAAIARAEMT